MRWTWRALLMIAAVGSTGGCKSVEGSLLEDAAAQLKCERSRLKADQMTGRERDTDERGFLVYCLSAPLDTAIPGPGGGGPHVTAWASYLCPSLQKARSAAGVFTGRCRLIKQGSGEPDPEQDFFVAP